MVNLLLDHGADPNVRCESIHETPLISGIMNESSEAVTALIERGADTNLATLRDGTTPLHSAAMRGHVAIFTALLNRGADPHKRKTGSYRSTTRQSAIELAVHIGASDIIRVLFEAGHDPNVCTGSNLIFVLI